MCTSSRCITIHKRMSHDNSWIIMLLVCLLMCENTQGTLWDIQQALLSKENSKKIYSLKVAHPATMISSRYHVRYLTMGKLMTMFVFVNCPRVKNKLFHFTIDNIFSALLIGQHCIFLCLLFWNVLLLLMEWTDLLKSSVEVLVPLEGN